MEEGTAEFLALQESLVGRYSLDRELGRGGMGIVYLAHEVALDRPVALKLLPPTLATQASLRDRFLREARTAAKLSHPNIVPIFAVDEIDDFVFFVMAYINGETLGQRIRTTGPIPFAESARVLREVAWALAYAHAQGVVHRDVKPDNILLEAGSGRALVTDFGIAHVREGPSMTSAGEVLGTAEFMSPEQASGEAVDGRSDLYSLGVVGYLALTGKLPFEGPSISAILAKHITEEAPPVRSVEPEVPAKLAKIVDRCLAKEPTHRFADGEALAEALGNTFERRTELPVALRVFLKKNQEIANSSAVLGLLLLFIEAPLLLAAAGGSAVAGVVALGVLVAFALASFGGMAQRARQLLKTGYGQDETVLALKTAHERRREELEFEYGRHAKLVERVARIAAAVGLGGAALAIVLVATFGSGPVVEGLGWLLGTAGLLGASIAAYRHGRRRDIAGERWLRLWKGWIGRLMFKIGRLGLKRLPTAVAATYRPTALAIGMAADRLFEELPKQTRKALGNLPEVVRRLEADAQRMRGRVEQLDAAIADVEGPARPGPAQQRDQLTGDLRELRDGAQRGLSEAVTALETLRLDLLRMRAGAGTIESVTADLAAASDLSEDIEHLLEGRQEVDALLAGR